MSEDHYRPPHKGKLLVIEGIDASGKETQTGLLHMKLQKIGAVRFDFPNYNNHTGRFIKEVMTREFISYHDEAWAQLLAANRSEDKEELLNSLRFTNVVCNRYYISNMVYSTASGLNTQWLSSLDSQMPKPDIVIILDIPAKVSAQRKSKRDFIESDIIYLEKVRQTYVNLASTMGWYVIGGDRGPQEVHQDILKIVSQEFNWNI